MATHQDHDRPVADSRTNGTATVRRKGAGSQVIEFDEFIDAQLRKTRSHVRSVDIAASLMTLAAGTLAFVLLAALVDHWLVTGGLGFWGRALFLVAYVLSATTYLAVRLLPCLLRNINPLYAADAIERSRPTLKNTLVNFLFFRTNRAGLSPVIYDAVEEQAAGNLARAHVDVAVDRSKLIKIGYVLLGILLVCAVYALMSPKDVFKTVGRIAVPWADISAPTRTTIEEIEPGDTPAFRGQRLTVNARVQDLPDDAKVMLYYTTADGQVVDAPIEMSLADDGYKHACTLPAGEASLQQDVSYRIEAGDAITRPYRVEVVDAPTIFVEALEYKYPTYTGLLAQRVERAGDVKAIEGTEITVEALANSDIQSAHVDFDCNGTLDQRMTADGQRAKATFRLALTEDRTRPKYGSYQLIFKNAAGQQNPQPVRHEIEVTRDIAPEIEFVAPKQDDVDLPANDSLALEIVANDPDFALALVKLSASKGGQPLFDKLLLDEKRRGQFVAKFRFEPAKLGLEPGDVVEYSALAEDNKYPGPNRTETLKRRVRIVSPDERQGKQDQVASNDGAGDGRQRPDDASQRGKDGDDQDQDRPSDDAPRDKNAKQPDDASKGESRDDAGGQQPSRGERSQDSRDKNQDDNAQQGKQQQGEKGGDQQQQRGDQQGEDKQGSGKEGAGEQGNRQAGQQRDGQQGEKGQEQQGEGQQGDGQQNSGSDGSRDAGRNQQRQRGGRGERSADQDRSVPSDGSDDGDAIEQILKHREQQEQQGKSGSDAQQQRNRDGSAEKQARDRQQAGDRQNAEQQAGDKQAADKQAGEKQAGEKQAGEKQQGGKQNGQPGHQGGDKQEAQKQAGDKQQGEQQRGQPQGDQPSGDKPGSTQSGDKQGDKQSGQGDPSGGSAKEKQSGQPQGQGAEPGAQKQPGKGSQQQPGAKKDMAKPDQQGTDQQGADQQGSGQQGQDKQAKDQQGAGKSAGDKSDAGQGDKKSTQGQGAQSKSDPSSNKNPQSQDAQRPDAKGGDTENNKGQSGAGQKSQDQQGSPDAGEQSQPRDKSQQPSGDDPNEKDTNQAQSPSHSKRESDSQGGDEGDRSGGGKRGGGQKANKPGTGGAGQNTAADEGAGASDEAGKGETSDRAGDDQAADQKTGKSGQQQGEGSGQKSAGDDGDKPGGDDAAGSPDDANSGGNDAKSDGTSGPGGANPTGGRPGGRPNDNPPERPSRTAPEVADPANLDYARKATDMALTHLKDELAKDAPDPELLDQLGWSRQDLENFVKRWEQMRAGADAPGEKGQTARRELDETLRSLGLRPRTTTRGANEATNDQFKGLKESRRSTPPPEYAEQVKAYTQGTARGGK